MNIIATIIAIVIVIAGVIYTRQHPEVIQQPQPEEKQIIEPEVEHKQQKPKQLQLTPTPPSSIPTPSPQEENLSSLKYPNSIKVRLEGETSVYESSDDPDTITDWYKGKIESLKMSTKSFVKTKTNDNVLNKLVGADGEKEIRVEISKPADSSTTEIKVTTN